MLLRYSNPDSPSEFYFRKSVEKLVENGEWMHDDSQEEELKEEDNDDDGGIDEEGYVSPEAQFQKMMKQQMKKVPKSHLQGLNELDRGSGPKKPFVPPPSTLLTEKQYESLLLALGEPEHLPSYHIPEVKPLPISKYRMPDNQESYLAATQELEGVLQQQRESGESGSLRVESHQQQPQSHYQQQLWRPTNTFGHLHSGEPGAGYYRSGPF